MTPVESIVWRGGMTPRHSCRIPQIIIRLAPCMFGARRRVASKGEAGMPMGGITPIESCARQGGITPCRGCITPCAMRRSANRSPQNSLNEACHGEVEPAHGLVRVVAWRRLPSPFHESVLRRAYICSGNWAHRVSPGFTAPSGKSAVWPGCFSLVAALYGEAATVPLPAPLP